MPYSEDLERAFFFCQMLNYGDDSAGLHTIANPAGQGFVTFAMAHLIFMMFLVEKNDKPIGGFIYPILSSIGKEYLLDKITETLTKNVADISFEDYLQKYRNKLATHGSLSHSSLPHDVRMIVLGDKHNKLMQQLMRELMLEVEDLTRELRHLLDE